MLFQIYRICFLNWYLFEDIKASKSERVILVLLFYFFFQVHFSTLWMQDHKCIVIDWPMTTTIVVFRSMTDIIYLLHMLLQVPTHFPSLLELLLGVCKLSLVIRCFDYYMLDSIVLKLISLSNFISLFLLWLLLSMFLFSV